MSDRDVAVLDALAPASAEVLLLRAAGVDDAAIAARLGLPPESVPVVAEIAARKLRRLVGEQSGRPGGTRQA